MQIFLAEPRRTKGGVPAGSGDGIGNCIACHPAPSFSDFSFHNTGVTQVEYDGVHGAGTFERLRIPDLSARLVTPDEDLPATREHPDATGRFRAPARAGAPGETDLGVWNVFANADFPKPQSRIFRVLCRDVAGSDAAVLDGMCSRATLLPRAIARFKTPGLRDLGHSGPYMHNGAFDTLVSVVEMYRTTSDLMRAHRLRNGGPEIADVRLSTGDIDALVAFLRALNEDYE